MRLCINYTQKLHYFVTESHSHGLLPPQPEEVRVWLFPGWWHNEHSFFLSPFFHLNFDIFSPGGWRKDLKESLRCFLNMVRCRGVGDASPSGALNEPLQRLCVSSWTNECHTFFCPLFAHSSHWFSSLLWFWYYLPLPSHCPPIRRSFSFLSSSHSSWPGLPAAIKRMSNPDVWACWRRILHLQHSSSLFFSCGLISLQPLSSLWTPSVFISHFYWNPPTCTAESWASTLDLIATKAALWE